MPRGVLPGSHSTMRARVSTAAAVLAAVARCARPVSRAATIPRRRWTSRPRVACCASGAWRARRRCARRSTAPPSAPTRTRAGARTSSSRCAGRTRYSRAVRAATFARAGGTLEVVRGHPRAEPPPPRLRGPTTRPTATPRAPSRGTRRPRPRLRRTRRASARGPVPRTPTIPAAPPPRPDTRAKEEMVGQHAPGPRHPRPGLLRRQTTLPPAPKRTRSRPRLPRERRPRLG